MCGVSASARLKSKLGVNMVVIHPIVGLAMEKTESDSDFFAGLDFEARVGDY